MEVPLVYIKAVLDELALEARVREQLLSGTGLDPATLSVSDGTVPLSTAISLVHAANALLTPGWHLGVTRALDFAHHGPVGIAVATSPTVGVALDTLRRCEVLRAPFAYSRASVEDGRRVLQIMPAVEVCPHEPVLMEMDLIASGNILVKLLGRRATALAFEFPEAERDYDEDLRAALPGRVVTDAKRYTLSLPLAELSHPCLLFDQAMHESALRKCEDLLSAEQHRSSLAREIRREILDAGGQAPDLEALARTRNISRRTLIRRLKDGGSSYREIVDDVHRNLASDALLGSESSVAEIAWQLGYQDAANFGRAFRRWFGQSPGAYRSAGRKKN